MEQWTQEQAIAYECARECITALIAVYTGQLHEEESRSAPNQATVQRLDAEITRLFNERRDLRLHDAAEVARVTTEYGALVRVATDALRCQMHDSSKAAES